MPHLHSQVEIDWFDEQKIAVDEGLADVIRECVRLEIFTLNSCQENQPGRAWIEFDTVQDAKLFMDIVANQFPATAKEPWNTLYGRVFGLGSDDDWHYDVLLRDNGAPEEIINDEVVRRFISCANVDFQMSIRFPVSDIPEILNRLKTKKSFYC